MNLKQFVASLAKPAFEHNKDLVELLTFLFAAQAAGEQAYADKKIDLRDLGVLYPLTLTGPNAFEGLGNIRKDWLKSTEDEKKEVFVFFEQNFDLKNDSVEELIEEGVQVTQLNLKFFNKVKTAIAA